MSETAILTVDNVLEALRLWHGRETLEWPLMHLRLRLLVEPETGEHASLADIGPAAQNRAILNRGLSILRTMAPEAEELLRERFEQRRDVRSVANSLNISESNLYYRQRQAVEQLTQILADLEHDASAAWKRRMTARLSHPSYSRLVGIEKPLSRLYDALMAQDEHFIIAIEGLGGLGKTALADYVARRTIDTHRFDEIAWTTAKHTHLSSLGRLQIESGRPALTFAMLIDNLISQFDLPEVEEDSKLRQQRLAKQYLRERACLIVIDNLETVADYRSLLPELRNWQSPSKFLLTSRRRLLDEPDIFSLALQELSRDAAFELIRMEARKTGFVALATAGNEDLQQIYDVVGGNPLALKLITGQLRFHSLPRVLSRFAGGKEMQSQEGIFDYIYREIWEDLHDESKMTLLTLTQAGATGFNFEHIVSVSGLSEATVDRCLEKLILLSLVDLTGDLKERRYHLHRLTEVFLLQTFAEEE